MVLEEAIRILSEAPVVWTPGGLHVCHAPWLWPEHAKQGFGMRRSRAHLEVERLLQQAAVRRPERRELEDEVLKGHETGCTILTRRDSARRGARDLTSMSSPNALQSNLCVPPRALEAFDDRQARPLPSLAP